MRWEVCLPPGQVITMISLMVVELLMDVDVLRGMGWGCKI